MFFAAVVAMATPCLAEIKNPAEDFDFFEKNIRPVLADKCYKCHSSTGEKIKGDLVLDSKGGMLKGGSTGPAIVPFKPEESLLIKAIRYTNEDLQMPPKGEKLSEAEIKNFVAWVKMGAPDPRTATLAKKYSWSLDESRRFWSFQPLKEPTPPATRNKKWPVTPIDHFILATLEENNLTPVANADKRSLIRRATFDLTGLPPTPKEIELFLEDKSPGAFERVIDRLLASGHYGEQWGRHWLDVVRYADTSGCNSDFPVPAAYRYRDYVIESFNADKPFDEFLKEQIAGDLLPHGDDKEKFEHVIATGYLAISRRFGSRNNEFHLTIEDTIDTLGKGLLGLSTGCARCHDHKFDPISQKEYYALYGIFSSTKYAFPGTEVYRHPKDFIPLATGEQVEALKSYQTEIAGLDDLIEELGEKRRALEARIEENEEDQAKAENEEEKQKLIEHKKELQREFTEVRLEYEEARTKQRKLESDPPDIPKAYAVSEGKPANAKLQKKGSPFQLGEEVPRGFLNVLGGQTLPADEKGSGRLQLAQWIAESPITARVMVNRIWQHHFGRGIVQTPNDFGTRGKAPTHPDLLEYLASEFVKGGGSIKAMHKKIMLSRAYQLSSAENAHNVAIDPENNLLWRYNRRRLSAEEIRDSMLAISGTLDRTTGGEHPFLPENEWKYTQHRPFVAIYETNKRSVYMMQQRIRKHPYLDVWDGADPNTSTGARPLTTTPLQALMLMNSSFAHEQADKFTVRIALAETDEKKRIDYAYQLAFGRPAASQEISQALAYLKECRGELRKTDTPGDELYRKALGSYARILFSSNEFLFLD
jgi:hypothetical protein